VAGDPDMTTLIWKTVHCAAITVKTTIISMSRTLHKLWHKLWQ